MARDQPLSRRLGHGDRLVQGRLLVCAYGCVAQSLARSTTGCKLGGKVLLLVSAESPLGPNLAQVGREDIVVG
jgi:hypothetical protein